jgi:hypothetical protein
MKADDAEISTSLTVIIMHTVIQCMILAYIVNHISSNIQLYYLGKNFKFLILRMRTNLGSENGTFFLLDSN